MSHAAFLGQARGGIPSGLTCCYISGGFLPSRFLCGHHGSPLGHARFISPWRQSGRDFCVGLARCTQEVHIGCNHEEFGVKCTNNQPYAFSAGPSPRKSVRQSAVVWQSMRGYSFILPRHAAARRRNLAPGPFLPSGALASERF